MTSELPIPFRPTAPPSPLPASDTETIVGGRVELQLLTTLKCNLQCSYCSLGVGEVLGSQTQVGYDIEQLAAFVASHLSGKEVYVTFYVRRQVMDCEVYEYVEIMP